MLSAALFLIATDFLQIDVLDQWINSPFISYIKIKIKIKNYLTYR